jgi:thiol-disulfide isomerase/thioredoxin
LGALAARLAGSFTTYRFCACAMTDLRGKVVLVDFWTYGCVNCVNTLPHVAELYAKYRDRGLVVVASTRRNSRSSDRHPTCRPR